MTPPLCTRRSSERRRSSRLGVALAGALWLAGASSVAAARDAEAGSRWFMQKPAPSTQVQKSSTERGVNPCNTPDPGFGSYDRWIKNGMAMVLVPHRGAVNAAGEFDVVFHFHGHEPARKEWVQAMSGVVFVGVTLGVGSGVYENTFRDPAAFEHLLKTAEATVAEHVGRSDAHARRIALSSWSAGYGAAEEILRQPLGRERVDTVILLDGLHCDYAGDGLVEATLEPFVWFAHEAADGKRLMVVSHSSIIPPGYASTTETANYLIHELGGRPHPAKPRPTDPMGLELVSRYDQGGFHVRGYAGNAELDHCAQVGLYRDVLKVHLLPRWKPPRAAKH
ncbi:MAG TPA: hypothetical protein VMI54_00015 [Polyangiaceae bacterium]|nr:hypothetical protein [Polyangiaceae bacterium]